MTLLNQFYVIPKIYIASPRYALSENETGSISSDNKLTRLQVAAGCWYADNVLVKEEYVTQDEDALSGFQNVTGTGCAEWDGVLLEASVFW